jgi:hypothetical protein
MLGKPKYNYGDVVKFSCYDLGEKEGIIAIIDRYGTWGDPSDVSYDILNKKENMLYKHCNEKYVIEKIGEIPEDEIWK